jgi:hypothetical protein
MDEDDDKPITLDLRHIGRMYDKEMPIDQAGMEMSKPGLPDLRRRKHSVTLPDAPPSKEPEFPPPTEI